MRADVRSLPFQQKKFDVVAAGRIFNYFRKDNDELSRVLDGIEIILNEDGYLIGDATLFPSLPANKLLMALKFTLYYLSYEWQIRKYSKAMEERGFKFLRKGVGIMPNEVTDHLKMFFVTQKE